LEDPQSATPRSVSHCIALGGTALHAGVSSSVVLGACPGPSVIEQNGARARLDELRVLRADRGVQVTDPSGAIAIDLFEHLAAAIGALQIQHGLRVRCYGPEIPLLDGGSLRWAIALRSLGLVRSPLGRRVIKAGRVQVGESIYDFAPADRVLLEVTIEFDHPLIAQSAARWDGDPDDFVSRIAPARTFGFLHEAEQLRATARARGANARDVVVLLRNGSSLSDPPPEPDECARHKMLDLIGDLTLAGGIARGQLHVRRPGHPATREALRMAVEQGIVGPG
jgi:UDP-3-O-[3-hydroxymyristoyl] N-acetylglucosamine deacetylase